MKNKPDWSSGNTVTLVGPVVCIDCRTRWQRFKDFFKPRRELPLYNPNLNKEIIHEQDSIKMP